MLAAIRPALAANIFIDSRRTSRSISHPEGLSRAIDAHFMAILEGTSEMDRKLVGALFAFVACCGCCACDNSCDYLPPVLDGPYSTHGMRSGAATAGDYAMPTPIASEPITPSPVTE